jgi:hypothetical protein
MALRKARLTFADGFVTECTVLTDDEVEFEGMATTRPAPRNSAAAFCQLGRDLAGVGHAGLISQGKPGMATS